MTQKRPLDSISSIKVRISIVIIAAVAVTAFMSQLGLTLGWPVWVRPVVAGTLALAMAQFLAQGMTRPLRKMAAITNRMANGDYTERIESTSRDEVGKLADAFDTMADQLAETERLRKEFVANASHELRTPVTALRSTIENLVDGIEQPNRSTLEQMLTQTENLSTLVAQLLDLSRLESGESAITQTELVDIGDLLHAVAEEVMLAQPSTKVTIRAPVGLRLEGRPQRLQQVFTNIIGNASRFSDPFTAVQVCVSQTENSARIVVRDSGPGIPVSERSRVFERFWQADGVARTSGGGAGLGLAISKHIVDNHSGQIHISDNQPTGACIVVSLPRSQEPPNTQPEKELLTSTS